MNPSASDWIPKYLSLIDPDSFEENSRTHEFIYKKLKATGFIYGISLETVTNDPQSQLKLTREEFTKVNLFHGLLHTYVVETNDLNFDKALLSIIRFYEALNKAKTGFFNKISFSSSKSQKLEKMLAARIHETNTFLNRGVTGVLTYALLYIDILAYKKSLHRPTSVKLHAEEIERTVITSCYLALSSKKKKNKYDRLLIDLFESSALYLGDVSTAREINLNSLKFPESADLVEKSYILDICTISIWDDHKMDEDEHEFLLRLANRLELTQKEVEQSLSSLASFTASNSTSIKLFEYANPVKLFYRQSTATVKLLILRNKKRLLKELAESGELLLLLTESTVRELSEEEKTKVKDQILDICKTIPSLTIFLLPGGTVLLPILIKFIPKLLPSAFNENRIKKK